jgi:hypothetical protein
MTTPDAIVRFFDEELVRAPALADLVVGAVLETLARANPEHSAKERQTAADAARALAASRPRLVADYNTALRRLVAADRDPGAKATPSTRPMVTTPRKLSLELLDETAVAGDVEIARMVEIARTTADYELRELSTFLATLAGDSEVVRDYNVLRPELQARAMWTAARHVTTDGSNAADVHLAYMRHAAAPLAAALRKLYAGMCARMEDAGVEPAAYRTIVYGGASVARGYDRPASHQGGHSGGGGGGSGHAGHGVKGAGPAASLHELSASLVSLEKRLAKLSNAPSAGAPSAVRGQPMRESAAPGGAAAAGTPNWQDHAAANRAIPVEAGAAQAANATHTGAPTTSRSTLEGGASTLPSDGSTANSLPQRTPESPADAIDRLFTAMLGDRELAADFKPAIANLQAPARLAAQHDATLLLQDEHPLWRLIDRIAWQGVTLPAPPQRERVRTMQVINGLVDQVAKTATPDGTRFQWALERMEGLERNRLERRIAHHARQTAALAAVEAQVLRAAGGSAASASLAEVAELSTVPAALFDPGPASAGGTPSDEWLESLAVGQVVQIFINTRWAHALLLWRGTQREVWLWGDCSSDGTWPIRRGALHLMHLEGFAFTATPRCLVRESVQAINRRAERDEKAQATPAH